MLDALARKLDEITILIATQSRGAVAYSAPQGWPPQQGVHAPRQTAGTKPSQSMATLMALNAALIACNCALRAALDSRERKERGFSTETRHLRIVDSAVPIPAFGPALLQGPVQAEPQAGPGSLAQDAPNSAILTPRQAQVMQLVLAGQPSKNIAADLGISQRTVENHRAAIMRRSGATSLPALARMAVGSSQDGDCR